MNGQMDQLNAIVAQRIEVSPGLIVLRVVPDGWELADFKSGQFAVLGLSGTAPRDEVSDPEEELANPDKIIKRAYSIASSSVANEYVEFYIVMVRSGALTPRLFALSVGDRLWLSPKVSGLFTLDEVPSDQHVLLISTGTGLAPYLSMLRSHLVCDEPRQFAVIHGARHSWDLGYRSELMTLDRMCPNFTYIATISRPEDEPARWAGETGYIQDVWQRGVLEGSSEFRASPEDTHVFLCGNPSMIVTMENLLNGLGFKEHKRNDPGNVHVERYW
jgi:ferredoxin--NADP+ reductase